MDVASFRKYAHEVVDWVCAYYENLEDLPVKSNVEPGVIYQQIPSLMPQTGEAFDTIWNDFQQTIIPGMTHWQHPHFHAYFNANTSFPSLLGEMAISALGAQCMIWDTSPAAAELEERMMEWLAHALGLPASWNGVIQDTASTATLCALLTAREKASHFEINQSGFPRRTYRIYSSEQAHSSLEKDVKIAGFGSSNLVKIATDDQGRMLSEALQNAIELDIQQGHFPLFVMAALGTTGTLAVDPLQEIATICKRHNLWLHVDAAYAGSALLLDNYRWMIDGIEHVDSFVYNPHKWLFTNFDCTAYFVKDKEALIRTFEILPEYLKTSSRGRVNDYRDWGVPLGRRFRALKLWFVLRTFGLDGLKQTVSNHITWTQELSKLIEKETDWHVMQETTFNMIVLRYEPQNVKDPQQINGLNQALLESINASGEAYLTHTKIKDQYVLRIVFGQTYLQPKHLEESWEILQRHAQKVLPQVFLTP